MNEGDNNAAVSAARIEQRLSKAEQTGGRGGSAADLAKAADVEEKLKRLKTALSKVEVQVSGQEARWEKASGTERQASARLAAVEAQVEGNKAAAEKKLATSLASLDSLVSFAP